MSERPDFSAGDQYGRRIAGQVNRPVLETMRQAAWIVGTFLFAISALAESQYHVISKYQIAGEGTWDYVTFDPVAGRLFVSHETQVEVIDAGSGKVLRVIPATPGVHGVALVQEIGKGYISEGLAGKVAVFDLTTLQVTGAIQAGKKPDAIIYDDGSKRVLVSNANSHDMTVIDPAAGEALATIDLEGAPEFIAADGKGKAWVALEDRNQVVMVDTLVMKVTTRFPLPGCEQPSAVAMARSTRRLLIGCRNKNLTVLDADSGRVIQHLPIGEHVDAGAFDDSRRLSFSSTGDGIITVIHEDNPGNYTVVGNIRTQRGAKTMALDPVSGRVFLPTAEGLPADATGPPSSKGPQFKTGQFVVLVVGK